MNDLKIRKFSKALWDKLGYELEHAFTLSMPWETWKRTIEPILHEYIGVSDAPEALHVVTPWEGEPLNTKSSEGVVCYDKETALTYLRLKRDNYIMDNPEDKNVALDTEEMILYFSAPGGGWGWVANRVNVISGA